MNYMGGKWRQGKVIAQAVARAIKPNGLYIEPFCGALGVAFRVAELAPQGTKFFLSDIHVPLINMWKAVFRGWEPPSIITEKEYASIKARMDYADPMTAYAGFGASFGGKYFGGYARNQVGTNFAANSARSIALKRSVMLKCAMLSGSKVAFSARDYKTYANVRGATFYLDPPYMGRTRTSKVCDEFKSDEFWDFAGLLSVHNAVFVTEFTNPRGWKVIHDFGDTVVRHHKSKGRDGTTELLLRR